MDMFGQKTKKKKKREEEAFFWQIWPRKKQIKGKWCNSKTIYVNCIFDLLILTFV